MIVEKKYWGRKLIIHETSVNCEYTYRLREVRKINNDDDREQELINRLEIPEKNAIRKLTLLLFSMENFFKSSIEKRKKGYDVFQEWEKHNRMDWHDWFVRQADRLEEEINSYSIRYAHESKHGWCL